MALVWLLGLLPAAIVTLFRNRWLLFVGGFLTFGLLWFVGALARDPDGPPDFSHAGPLIAAVACAALVLGLFGARPAPVLGVDGETLQSSFAGVDILSFDPESCEREARSWTCSVYEGQISGTISYRVRVGGMGCWQAVRIGPAYGDNPKHLSGCVNLVNYVV